MANCVKSSWLLLTACQTVQTQRYKETQTQRDKATQTERQRLRHTLLIDSAVHHHVLSQPPDILRSDENMRLQWSVWFDIMLKRLNTCFIVVFIVSWVNITVGIEDVQFISRYSSVHWIYTHTFFFPPIPQMWFSNLCQKHAWIMKAGYFTVQQLEWLWVECIPSQPPLYCQRDSVFTEKWLSKMLKTWFHNVREQVEWKKRFTQTD